MYLALYSVDGGKGINIFNYVLLFLVTITGMIVRFHSEVLASRQAVDLAQSNDLLFYNNRHDGLTGLRNRKALEEDEPEIPGVKVLLSIGRSNGTPKDHSELHDIISKADQMLYDIKRKTHAPENGGHGERSESV